MLTSVLGGVYRHELIWVHLWDDHPQPLEFKFHAHIFCAEVALFLIVSIPQFGGLRSQLWCNPRYGSQSIKRLCSLDLNLHTSSIGEQRLLPSVTAAIERTCSRIILIAQSLSYIPQSHKVLEKRTFRPANHIVLVSAFLTFPLPYSFSRLNVAHAVSAEQGTGIRSDDSCVSRPTISRSDASLCTASA